MEIALILAVPAITLGVLYCLWRAWGLLSGWRPAVANVVDSDYDSPQQKEDFWSFGFTALTSRGWNWRDGENARLIEDRIVFEDGNGTRHRATVKRRVRRGWRPSAVYTVWYDPEDPDRVTAFGPFYWLLMALVCGIMLVTVFSTGMSLAGKIGPPPIASKPAA